MILDPSNWMSRSLFAERWMSINRHLLKALREIRLQAIQPLFVGVRGHPLLVTSHLAGILFLFFLTEARFPMGLKSAPTNMAIETAVRALAVALAKLGTDFTKFLEFFCCQHL